MFYRLLLPRVRWMRPLLGGVVLAAVLTGCASSPQLSISPAMQPEKTGDHELTLIEKENSVMVELLNPTFSDEIDELPTFEVVLENRGAEAFFFSPRNISVYSGDETVRAYSVEELAARIQGETYREAEEYSGQQAEVFLQAEATRLDPSSAMATIPAAKRTNRAAASRESRQKLLREAGDLLSSVRIPPGKTAGGALKLHAEDIQPGQPLRIVVSLQGESYEFTYEVAEG